MSKYLGFLPVKEAPFIFLSYNNDDYERITPITKELGEKLPFWYDYAIPYDDLWEDTIERKISEANAVILFLTNNALVKNSFIKKEYKLAQSYQKKVIVILLDNITASNAPFGTKSFVIDVLDHHTMNASNLNKQEIITEAFKVIKTEVNIEYNPDKVVPTPPKANNKFVLFFSILLVLLSGILGSYYYLTTPIPNIKGLDFSAASIVLENVGLHLEEGNAQHSEDIEKDLIISTNGWMNRIKKGGIVTAVLSLGPSIEVPNVSGLKKSKAINEIKSKGLTPKINEAYSDSIEEGMIISQNIPEGTILSSDDEIILIVSLGSKPFEIESFVDSTLKKATEAAEDLGLSVTVKRVYNDTVKKGNVISQSPKAGNMLQKGDTIIFKVSKGIETIKVPDLKKKSPQEAKELLEEIGLTLGEVTYDYSDNISNGFVMSQGTNPGKSVKKGSSISIVLSQGVKVNTSNQNTYNYGTSGNNSYTNTGSRDSTTSGSGTDSAGNTGSGNSTTQSSGSDSGASPIDNVIINDDDVDYVN